jgi:hypothetical protein
MYGIPFSSIGLTLSAFFATAFLCVDTDHKLSSAAPFFDRASVGLGGPVKRKNRIDFRAEIARVEHSADPGELFAIGLHNEKTLFCSLVDRRLAIRSDGNHSPARLEHAPGSPQGFAADGVEHDIDFRDLLFEWHGAIIDHSFRA